MNADPLLEIISRDFKDHLCLPFPTKDISKLQSIDDKNLDIFHTEIDIYLATLAGYAERPKRLRYQSKSLLIQAQQFLSKSIFEMNPEFSKYRDAINKESTPDLFDRLESAERLRINLFVFIQELLFSQDAK